MAEAPYASFEKNGSEVSLSVSGLRPACVESASETTLKDLRETRGLQVQ